MLIRLLKLLIMIVCMAFVTSLAEVAVAARPGPRRQGARVPAVQRESVARTPLSARGQASLARAVRQALTTLPYYDVFDWLESEVRGDGKVILRGQVVRPATRADAEARVREIDGAARVVNEIEVLPVSPDDERLRFALYRALYNFDSPLFRYATRVNPPIHIVVKHGRATMKGEVASEHERNLAYAAARGVPGLFEVTNELRAAGAPGGPR